MMHAREWLLILKLGVGIALITWFFRQCRKPTGWLGKRIINAMNLSHSKMTDWGLEQVQLPTDGSILDIGCGGGATIHKLVARVPQGKVHGLDYSATCVAVARETNAAEIAYGRVQIEQGSVAKLPFADGSFDLVTAVETHYYWPDLPANVGEVERVLKPGGSFVLIAETYRGGPLLFLYALIMPLLRAKLLSDAEHRNLLTRAGFVDVTTRHQRGKNWIVASGRRALSQDASAQE